MNIFTGTKVYGLGNAEIEVLEFIGQGGFGTVFRAKELSSGRIMALKTLSTPFSNQKEMDSFINEGRLAVGVDHPNVVKYLYFHDGTTFPGIPPYILMEFAEDGTLAELLDTARRTSKQFTREALTGMFRQLVAGMEAINAKVVHRDLKPENILISRDTLKITDFGLAKMVMAATRSHTFKGGGTLPYIAPEAWRNESNTVQLDIYALGIVFYEIATLRLPIDPQTNDVQKWRDAHLFDAVTSPEKLNSALGPNLAQVIMKMIEKSTSKRFQNWASISALLGKNEASSSHDNLLVQRMLQKRLHADSATQAKEAEDARKAEEAATYRRLVLSQANQQIIQPMINLIEDFNGSYVGQKVQIKTRKHDEGSGGIDLVMPSGAHVQIHCRAVREGDFVRDVAIKDYGRIIHRTQFYGKIKDRLIQGWGKVSASDKRGFNLALLEKADDLYGEWFMILNRSNAGFTREERPNPFAFDDDELEKEIPRMDAFGMYDSEVRPLDINYVMEFVAGYA